jgi:dTDP-glucose pyrophosphorylase
MKKSIYCDNDEVNNAAVSTDLELRVAVEKLNANPLKFLACIQNGRLVGTITDGDLRRALLNGVRLGDTVKEAMHSDPFVVSEDSTIDMVGEIMDMNGIDYVPIVDGDHKLVGLHRRALQARAAVSAAQMIIMAGGKGVRLRPATNNCPKPMLLVADKPMLQHIIEKAKAQEIKKFTICVNYLGNVITDFFGDGRWLDVEIDYVFEKKNLGTAGALSILSPKPSSPFLVTNGDLITDLKYMELSAFMESHDADGAMALREYELENPFGVVDLNGASVIGITEKPVLRSHINAGIYAFKPSVLSLLEENTACDMPKLIERVIKNSGKIVGFPMHEKWLDVGRAEDLKTANREAAL